MECEASMIEAVIFDMDGTLIRLPLNYPRLEDRLKPILENASLLTGILPAVKELKKLNEDAARKAFNIMDEEEVEAISKVEVCDNSPEMLKDLKKQGLKLGLVTLQGRKVADLILKKLSLTDLFESIQTRENSMERVEQIQACLQALQVQPRDAVVVGDRLNDVNSANSLGCRAFRVGPQGSTLTYALREILASR